MVNYGIRVENLSSLIAKHRSTACRSGGPPMGRIAKGVVRRPQWVALSVLSLLFGGAAHVLDHSEGDGEPDESILSASGIPGRSSLPEHRGQSRREPVEYHGVRFDAQRR